MTEVVEAVEPSTELAVREPSNLFRTEDPDEVIEKATRTANALASVVRQKDLATSIKGREHVRVEGWTLLGSMLGVFAVCTETRKLEDGWHARVEARTLTGAVVGAAEAECLRSEKTWASRDDYALLSMAQTRATSKALRQPLGFIMTLAGFQAIPAEEMPAPEPAPEPKRLPASGQPATEGQRRQVNELLEALEASGPFPFADWDWTDEMKRWVNEQFPDTETLNKAQVTTLIVEMETWLAQAQDKAEREKAE